MSNEEARRPDQECHRQAVHIFTAHTHYCAVITIRYQPVVIRLAQVLSYQDLVSTCAPAIEPALPGSFQGISLYGTLLTAGRITSRSIVNRYLFYNNCWLKTLNKTLYKPRTASRSDHSNPSQSPTTFVPKAGSCYMKSCFQQAWCSKDMFYTFVKLPYIIITVKTFLTLCHIYNAS